MPRRLVTPIAGLALGGWLGCAPSPPADAVGLRVAVSLPPQAWMVERIADGRALVDVVLPSSASPETWTPTPAAMLVVGDADLYFAVGHPSLAFESRLRSQAASSGTATVDFGRPEVAGDPHRWLDLDAVRQASATVAAQLAALDPAGATHFETNAAALRVEIDALERRLGTLLTERQRSVVVVQHPAWARLLGRFGVEELAIEHEGKEPDPMGLIEIVQRARREGVPVIFVQQGVSPRSARLIAAEIGARIEPLDPLAREWPETLERAVSAFSAALR